LVLIKHTQQIILFVEKKNKPRKTQKLLPPLRKGNVARAVEEELEPSAFVETKALVPVRIASECFLVNSDVPTMSVSSISDQHCFRRID
jgi:hypothetical protein